MPGTLLLQDDCIYSEAVIRQALGLGPSELAEARKTSGLRSRVIGKQHYYYGRHLREWIEGVTASEPAGVAS